MNYKPSVGKRIAAVILAVLFGALHPIMLIYQVMLPFPAIMPALVMVPVVLSLGGLVPAVVLLACGGLSSLVLMGLPVGASALPAFLLPGIVCLFGVRKKQNFFLQLEKMLVCAIGGMVISFVLISLLLDRDPVGQVMSMLRTVFESNKEYFRTMISSYNSSLGSVTLEDFSAAYYEVLNSLEVYYRQSLLANVLGGAVLTSVLSVLWANWIQARHAEATSESFQGLSKWFLPHGTTIGILLTLGLSYLLTYTNMSAAVIAWKVVSMLAVIAFDIQGSASLNRSMLKRGWSTGKRTAFTVLYIIVALIGTDLIFGITAAQLFAFTGACSALFGSHGIIGFRIEKED